MRNLLLVVGLAAVAGAGLGRVALATSRAPEAPPETVREILVPFEDLDVVLEGGTRRVLLSRKEYEDLLERAKREAESRPPRGALILSADYDVRVGRERAEVTGRLEVGVLEKGLHALGLDLAGVGLRSATLGERGAAIGLADDGRPTLFVEGEGRHTLVLEMVTPIETTAARQILNFRLPAPPAAGMRLTVPGDVEVKSGAAVVSRTFDQKEEVTRFVLVPPRGSPSLVMTLNSRLKRRDRVVVARSVLVDEVAEAYERLHATVSLAVLHRAVDRFAFAVPEGFEVTDVHSPHLARWAMSDEAGRRVLEVYLRDETTDTVVLNVSAVRAHPDLESWRLPKLEPLDVAGHVAIVGLLVEDRLKAESIEPTGLIRIGTGVLGRAMPSTVLSADPGAAPIRPVAAYYAPQGEFGLGARFVKPPARLLVTTNVLLILTDGGQEVRGGFSVLPEAERLFALEFTVPDRWDVTEVTSEAGDRLAFERYGGPEAGGRVRVRLARGLPVGEPARFYFRAVHTPTGWLGAWETTRAAFPVFGVVGEIRDDVGAIAVDARDDMTVRPESLERLMPLDENEKAKYGLEGVATDLAYRYTGRPYAAALTVQRTLPRLTARTYSFFKVERDALLAHYEIAYDVGEARAKRLALVLPATTPAALSVTGLDGVGIKEYASEDVEGVRRWTAILEEPRAGTVRLAVDFQQRLAEEELADLALPSVRADGVAYQSGLVSVEGGAELDVRVVSHPRRVDIGELAEAEYQPGRRLLGAFGFVGEPEAVQVRVVRHPACPLPPAIVQRGELVTMVGADGTGQTAARFLLRTKALFLEVGLPAGSTLWSATLDGRPAKPQREGGRLLLSLPPGDAPPVRDLTVVYETPLDRLGWWGGLEVPSPRLSLKAEREAAGEAVPMADLVWRLHLPTGYRVVRSKGTVVTESVPRPALGVSQVAAALFGCLGGVDFDHGVLGLSCGAVELASLAPLTRARHFEGAEKEALKDGAFAEDESRSLLRVDREKAEIEGEHHDALLPDLATATEEAVPAPPKPAAPPPTAMPERPADKPKAVRAYWALEGVRSLRIALEKTGSGIQFHSLGEEPRIDVAVVSEGRVGAVAWALASAVFWAGLLLTGRPARRKAAYVVGVGLVATLLPVVAARPELALVLNGAFYAACVLVAYYLVASGAVWAARRVRLLWAGPVATAALVLLAAGVVGLGPAEALATQDRAYVVNVVEPAPPVEVPEDAIILPYDPASKTGIQDADRLLVPYEKFLALWNQAHPEERTADDPPPAPYALAGAVLRAELLDRDFLLLEGHIDLDVFTDEYAIVPLPLEGGVLARADLDGAPARLSVAQMDPRSEAEWAQTAPAARKGGRPKPFVVLYVSGKGRHRLELAVRMKLDRRGGWRVASGRLPAAPATALEITVPSERTEVRLGDVSDRPAYETEAAGETIRTALGPAGGVEIQWRPKVSEGQVDQGLTAVSRAVLDVQEDTLRVAWSLEFQFRRGERDFFSVEVPEGYIVEKVEGTNVRGWEVQAGDGRQKLNVDLLKQAKESETFAVHLWRKSPIDLADGTEFDVPVVSAPGALRHSGWLLIRRSPVLDLRVVSVEGVRRTDWVEPASIGAPEVSASESPLGIRAYQAYEFGAMPFAVRLGASAVSARTSATVQTILRVAERERSLESRAVVTAQDRPIHEVRLLVPANLRLDRVLAPGTFEWAVTEGDGRSVLTLYLAEGVEGEVAVVVEGRLGEEREVTEVALPRVAVLDVDRMEGDLVVQVDPAFDIRAENLERIESIFLSRVHGWLAVPQRRLARLALHYKTADYAGRLVLAARTPDVTCTTVTNVRVTDIAVEETILVDFTVRSESADRGDGVLKGAGVREVVFRLPAWMRDARISAPLLRQKTVEPIEEAPGWVRVRLELQDELLGQVRVLVENDRLLAGEVQEAPIPVVETGQTNLRYVALENAGRDEVVLEATAGLEGLSRQQNEWQRVAELLQGGMTQAFMVSATAAAPRLAFRTKQRVAVETAGARIGLSRTRLVLDASGAYRAEQVYRLDNRTEQFLTVELPEGTSLWTVTVAGKPVKPVRMAGEGPSSQVQIPLVKTAEGDLDYAVVLKYGGRLGRLSALAETRFPLARTVNIQAELSQVELYLPETFAWFDFDGNMGQVAGEGEYLAGFLAYQNKMAQRLVQAVQAGTEFTQVRARHNLKQIGTSLRGWQDDFSGVAESNDDLQIEISNAGQILVEADQAVEQMDQAVRSDAYSNSAFMWQKYSDQDNRRARNLVNDLGANWSGVAETADVADKRDETMRFNDAWIEGNQLKTSEDGDGVATVDGKRVAVDVEVAGRLAERLATQGQKGLVTDQPRAAGVAQKKVQAELEEQAAAQQAREGEKRGRGARGMQEVVERYQSKLEAHGRRQTAVTGPQAAVSAGGVAARGGEWFEIGVGGGAGEGRPAGGMAEAGAEAGLASLDVELPARGVLYRFTTPRGDVEITARAVSRETVADLWRVALVVVLVVAGYGLQRVARAYRWRPRFGWGLAVLCAALGVVGALAGVFPVLGLILVVVGIVQMVRLARVRRREAAAA